MSDPFVIREMREEDRSYISDAWRRSFYGDSAMVSGADREHYNAEMSRVFAELMPEGGSTVRVAVDRKDDSLVVGFVCRTGRELHYCYVMDKFRGLRLVPAMLEGEPVDSYTFRTQMFEKQIRMKQKHLRFTPRFTL